MNNINDVFERKFKLLLSIIKPDSIYIVKSYVRFDSDSFHYYSGSQLKERLEYCKKDFYTYNDSRTDVLLYLNDVWKHVKKENKKNN